MDRGLVLDRRPMKGSNQEMEPQIFHLYLSAEGGEIEALVKEAPFSSGAVFRGPCPSLGRLPEPEAPPFRRPSERRDVHSAWEQQQVDDEERLGEALFEAAFGGEVGDAYRLARASGRALRIVLELAAREDRRGGLQALPWECLYDPVRRRFLAREPPNTLSRFLPPRFLDRRQPLATRLRVLVVASEAGPGHLDLTEELRRLDAALRRRWWLSREVLRNPTRAQLFDRVSRGGFHVLHFMGHGTMDRGRGALILPGDDGRPLAERAEGLAAEIQKAAGEGGPLRLAFLNACETARSEDVRPFAAVATALVAGGVPAVIAMQQPVRDDEAILFSGSVYRQLVRGVAIDRAVAEARRRLFLHRGQWWAPVLYSRLEDGRLFAPSAARRWLQGAAAAALAAALAAAGWLGFAPSPEGFPRTRSNQEVRVAAEEPCGFVQRELLCRLEIDLLTEPRRAVPLHGRTRLTDNQGTRYFLDAVRIGDAEYRFDAPAERHPVDLEPGRSTEVVLVFDGVSRQEKKAGQLEVLLGSGQPLRLGGFFFDRDELR